MSHIFCLIHSPIRIMHIVHSHRITQIVESHNLHARHRIHTGSEIVFVIYSNASLSAQKVTDELFGEPEKLDIKSPFYILWRDILDKICPLMLYRWIRWIQIYVHIMRFRLMASILFLETAVVDKHAVSEATVRDVTGCHFVFVRVYFTVLVYVVLLFLLVLAFRFLLR